MATTGSTMTAFPAPCRSSRNGSTCDTVPVWRNLDFPVVALEANQYFVFASANKHDRMA